MASRTSLDMTYMESATQLVIPAHWQLVISWAVLVAGFLTAVGVIHSKLIKPILIKRVILPVKTHVEQVRENNEAVRNMVGTFVEMNEMVPKLKQVCKMILPNHGSSLPDGINRIESQLLQLTHQMASSEAIQEALLLDHPKAVFICNDSGHNVFANKKYAEILECDREELNDLGWRSFLIPEDIRLYDTLWKTAFTECRDSFFALKMVTKKSHKVIGFSVKVSVLRSGSGKPTGQFMGLMDEITQAMSLGLD